MSSIKLTADSGGGTFELKAPASSGNTRVITLPDTGNLTLGPDNQGVTMIDEYRVHTTFQGNADPVQNFERSDTATMNFPIGGSGMTESSGIFTFPQTGIYLLQFQVNWFFAGDEREVIINIEVSSNSGSNYTQVALSRGHIKQCEGTNTHSNCIASAIIDVTNASTFRAKGRTDTGGSNVSINGNSGATETFFRFTRLGDT